MEYSDFKDGKKADLGIVNVGGLRNNMPKGVVRRGDIILISPFDNRLAMVYIKGSDLLSLFQDVAAVHAVRSLNCDVFFQGNAENQHIQKTSDYDSNQEKKYKK